MIATLAEIKAILGISDNSKDTQINTLIPMVESDLIVYCNNLFLDTDIRFSGSCSITKISTTYKIECAGGGMDLTGFAIGDTILLQGSLRNDKYYTISGINANYIQVSESVVAESARDMQLTLTSFPSALKIYISKMISYQMNHANDSGITSESIGNYSYSRGSNSGDAGYPSEILKALDKWRKVSTKLGSIVEMFRDYRGYTKPLGEAYDK